MSAVLTPTSTPSPWRPALLALGLTWLLLGVLYADTVTTMVGIWHRSETFAHAFLVAPITLWLVWRKRVELAALSPQPQPWLWLPMAALGALWLLADLVLVNAAAQFAWVGMLVLTVPAVLGAPVARVILFPLLFLFFGVPFGEFMLPPMMDWTADFVVIALQLTGIPVYREGLHFIIPSGSWSVIDECSGVRYLIASFMVGSLFAYLNYRSYWRRALFMLVSILVPIVANWLRAYIIVMLGHLSGNTIAVGVDHLLYGWVFFGVVIFVMFIIGARWSEPEAAPAAPPARGLAGGGLSRAGLMRVAALGTAAVVVLPHAALWGLQRLETGTAAPQLALPVSVAPGWTLSDKPDVEWSPSWLGATAVAHQGYTAPAGHVGVYAAYYRGQDTDSKLVSSLNAVIGMNERRWNPVGSGQVRVDTASGTVSLRVNRILGPTDLGTRRPHVVAWRVYWIDGRYVSGDIPAKIYNALARLRGRGDDGAALVLYAVADSFDAAAARLQAFVPAGLVELDAALQATRDAR